MLLPEGAEREPGQLGGRVGGAAHARVAGRGLQLPYDSGVWPGRAEGEMPRSLLWVAREVGNSAMRLAEPDRGSCGVHRRREERVDELDPPVHLDAHEPRLLRRRELDRIDRLRVGPRQGRGAQQRVARLGRKGLDACLDERVEVLWDGNAARDVPLAAAVELARDLDGVERVAVRCLRDPHERRPRKCAPELLREHAMEGGDRERPQFDVLDLEVALESRKRRSGKLRRAHREEAPHRLLTEPAQRELDRRRRRGIEPVEVVDRADDLRFAGERAEQREESGADDATLGSPCGDGAQQSRVETHPLRLGQEREELVRHVGEQSLASPAKASRASDSVGRAIRTRALFARACSTAACHSVVLPIPGSPTIATTHGRSELRKVSTAPSSASRPTRLDTIKAYAPLRISSDGGKDEAPVLLGRGVVHPRSKCGGVRRLPHEIRPADHRRRRPAIGAAGQRRRAVALAGLCRTGVPGDDWPAYTSADRAVKVFDRRPRVEYDPHADRRQAWEGLLAGHRLNPSLAGNRLRGAARM